jgi:hypothetical protein
MIRVLLLIGVLLPGGLNAAAARAFVNFPGSRHALRSPDGRFELRNVDADGSTVDPAHVLLVVDRASGIRRVVRR